MEFGVPALYSRFHTIVMRVCWLPTLLLSVSLYARGAWGKEASTEFKIVPGNAGKVAVALDTPPIPGSTCIFEWSSTGATTELWTARVKGDPRSGEIECEIERKGGAETYLLFSKFKTKLGTGDVLSAVVHDNDGELEEDHYDTEGECVENAHDWAGGSIRRIALTSMVIS